MDGWMAQCDLNGLFKKKAQNFEYYCRSNGRSFGMRAFGATHLI